MYTGWFCLGGTEIINNTRTMDYARSADCAVTWFKNHRCAGINDYLDEPPYNFATISQAPWYDPDIPYLSSEFLGVYCLTVDGLEDETLEAPITERVVGGGIIGRQRDASKSVRFRVVLTATTERGREYGRAWLAQVLRENLCGTHDGGSCGTSDLNFLTNCPNPYDPESGASEGGWRNAMQQEQRILHGVKCTTGLLKEQEMHRNGAYGGVYEFILTAEKPRMLGLPYILLPGASGTTIVQDAPFNLAPYPSAELAGAAVVVAENISQNPSLETNATGWAKTQSGAITSGMTVAGRVTGELAAVGTASYRSVFTATGASAVLGSFSNEQEVALTAGANARYSISMWSASVVMAGAPVRNDITFTAYWRSSAGGTVLRTDVLGTVDADGGAVSVKSILPPVGATHVLVRATLPLPSWNAGTIVRLYSDALAVTNP